jgi:hypothetical protein
MQVATSLDQMTAAEWDGYRRSIVEPNKTPRAPGAYAVAVRKRQAAED